MGLRGWVAVAVVLEAALLAGVACSSFSGNDQSVTGDAATDGDGPIADAKPGADSSGSFTCSTFDAASLQPPSSLTDQTCPGPFGGSGLNLGSETKNCGWCGHDCLGATCSAGHCAVTSLTATGTQLIGTGKGRLIYQDTQFQVLGGPLGPTMDASVVLGLVPVAELNRGIYHGALSDRIYLRTFSQMYSVPFDGGGLTLFHGPLGTPGMVAAAGGHVFETIPPDLLYDFRDDGTQLHSVGGAAGARDITATPDGRLVFYVGRNAADAGFDAATDASTYGSRASIYRYDVAKNQVTHMVDADWTAEYPSQLIVADAQYVFYVEAGSGDIKRFDVDAVFPAVTTVVSHGNGRTARTLVADGERLYWFRNTGGIFYSLRSTSKCGGGELEYAVDQPVPYPATVDGPFLYFSNSDQQTVRLPK